MRNNFDMIDDVCVRNITDDMIQNWVNQFTVNHAPKTVKNNVSFIQAVLKKFDVEINVTLPREEVKETFVLKY